MWTFTLMTFWLWHSLQEKPQHCERYYTQSHQFFALTAMSTTAQREKTPSPTPNFRPGTVLGAPGKLSLVGSSTRKQERFNSRQSKLTGSTHYFTIFTYYTAHHAANGTASLANYGICQRRFTAPATCSVSCKASSWINLRHAASG
jgi:hypothetical protein